MENPKDDAKKKEEQRIKDYETSKLRMRDTGGPLVKFNNRFILRVL
jgi:hypothetical protein